MCGLNFYYWNIYQSRTIPIRICLRSSIYAFLYNCALLILCSKTIIHCNTIVSFLPYQAIYIIHLLKKTRKGDVQECVTSKLCEIPKIESDFIHSYKWDYFILIMTRIFDIYLSSKRDCILLYSSYQYFDNLHMCIIMIIYVYYHKFRLMEFFVCTTYFHYLSCICE